MHRDILGGRIGTISRRRSAHRSILSGSEPTVAKRPRFSRWRRLPPVFRTGEHRPIGTGQRARPDHPLPADPDPRPGRSPRREGGDPDDPGLLRATADRRPSRPSRSSRRSPDSRPGAGRWRASRRSPRTPTTSPSGRRSPRRSRAAARCRPPHPVARRLTVNLVLADGDDAAMDPTDPDEGDDRSGPDRR